MRAQSPSFAVGGLLARRPVEAPRGQPARLALFRRLPHAPAYNPLRPVQVEGDDVRNRRPLTAGSSAAPHIGRRPRPARRSFAKAATPSRLWSAMAATIAVVYPHMNAVGGDGFWLLREPSGEVRYIEACGVAGSRADRFAFYRDRGHDVIPARGPLAALTTPAAVDGWRARARSLADRRRPAAAQVLLSEAVRHARDGFAVSPCQGRTVPKLYRRRHRRARLRRRLHARRQAALGAAKRSRSRALADTLEHIGRAGPARLLRGRRRARDRRRPRPHRRAGDARGPREPRRPAAAAARGPAEGRRVFNSQPPTQGLASLMILGILERLGVDVRRGRGVRPRCRRGDQARLPHARPHVRRLRPDARRPARLPDAARARPRGGRDRPRPRRALPDAGVRRGRHHLDGRDRRQGQGGQLHPVHLLGIRLRLRAAGDRRSDAEPRRGLLARSGGARTRSRRAASRSTR